MQQTYSRTSPWEIPVLRELQEKLRNSYTLMVDHYAKGNVKEGQELAHRLVLSGAYPESVHARLVSGISCSPPSGVGHWFHHQNARMHDCFKTHGCSIENQQTAVSMVELVSLVNIVHYDSYTRNRFLSTQTSQL